MFKDGLFATHFIKEVDEKNRQLLHIDQLAFLIFEHLHMIQCADKAFIQSDLAQLVAVLAVLDQILLLLLTFFIFTITTYWLEENVRILREKRIQIRLNLS